MVGIPSLIFVLLVAALIVSALGFYKIVYFISIGYAFSITALVVISVIAFSANLTWVSILQNAFLLIWSLRLAWYLLRREVLPSFSGQKQRNAEMTANVTTQVRFFIWISVALLYVGMFSPSLFVLAAPTTPPSLIPPVIGLIIMGGGLLLEAAADQQKSNFKAKHPTSFCNVGLYRWMRCPNYLGEILFWLGNWVAALVFYVSAVQWIISALGLICIILIMLGSTKRLERSQEGRYGSLPEYQTYIRTVPVLLPLVPVYTLKHIRVYLE
ncbi:MAG TPA: DUF1295 domain-containing protein [Phototrophicaceae bacterium]|nr:DUF1295 domain-containing protein [Phototrophicaceae bacterium]